MDKNKRGFCCLLQVCNRNELDLFNENDNRVSQRFWRQFIAHGTGNTRKILSRVTTPSSNVAFLCVPFLTSHSMQGYYCAYTQLHTALKVTATKWKHFMAHLPLPVRSYFSMIPFSPQIFILKSFQIFIILKWFQSAILIIYKLIIFTFI